MLLHGDGQYAPEVMQSLLTPLESGEADMVMGSRMMEPGAARRGNMPMYKYVGNKVLTFLENRLAGQLHRVPLRLPRLLASPRCDSLASAP